MCFFCQTQNAFSYSRTDRGTQRHIVTDRFQHWRISGPRRAHKFLTAQHARSFSLFTEGAYFGGILLGYIAGGYMPSLDLFNLEAIRENSVSLVISI